MPPAELDGRRPAARSGRDQDARSRRSRQRGRQARLERGRVPREQSRRHPVRRGPARRLRLLQELRRDAARKASSSASTATVGKFDFGASYTWLDATYRSDEIVNGDANSTNDGPAPGFEGDIDVRSGDRIPLTPRNLLKAYASWAVAREGLARRRRRLRRGLVRARQREQRASSPTASTTSAPARRRPTPWSTSARTSGRASASRCSRRSTTCSTSSTTAASLLAATGFTASGAFSARPFPAPVIDGERPLAHATFYAPGAPRSLWVGASYSFGATLAPSNAKAPEEDQIRARRPATPSCRCSTSG